MKHLLLALLLTLTPACASIHTIPPAYVLEVTNSLPEDVVVYLVGGGRRRLGRLSANQEASFDLSRMAVESGFRAILVCRGGAWTPRSRRCARSTRMRGAYPGQRGEPGVVLLHIQRGVVNGLGLMLNG